MASAAEQMASNLSFANFSKATELKSRIWFTLGALVVSYTTFSLPFTIWVLTTFMKNIPVELEEAAIVDGAGKMSKSENQYATLYLADEDDLIRKKVMKAKTDAGPTEPNSVKPDYIENLFQLMRLVSTPDTIEKFESDFNNCVIRYGDMKKQLGEDIAKFVAPIREKAAAIQSDDAYLKNVMLQGAEKARISAQKTIELTRQAMGLNYF